MAEDELPDVPALQLIEPPPGGLTALRARLDDEPRRRRWWAAALPAVALALAIVLVLKTGPRATDETAPTAAPTALADPGVGGTDVAFYWVSSTPGPQHATNAAIELPTISVQDAPQVAVVAIP